MNRIVQQDLRDCHAIYAYQTETLRISRVTHDQRVGVGSGSYKRDLHIQYKENFHSTQESDSISEIAAIGNRISFILPYTIDDTKQQPDTQNTTRRYKLDELC